MVLGQCRKIALTSRTRSLVAGDAVRYVWQAHCAPKLSTCVAYDHPQGNGSIVKSSKCGVRFDLYLPQNMERWPWALVVARGSHKHHPPYPTKLPAHILADLFECLESTDILKMTGSELIHVRCTAYARAKQSRKIASYQNVPITTQEARETDPWTDPPSSWVSRLSASACSKKEAAQLSGGS